MYQTKIDRNACVRGSYPHTGVNILAVLLLSCTFEACAAERTAAPCVEVTVPLDVIKAADAGATEVLEQWKPPEVCAAVATRLNQRCPLTFKNGEPPFPADRDFQFPKWRKLDSTQSSDILRKILEVAWHPYRDPDDAWTHLTAQLKDRDRAKQIALSVAEIDLWNTGTEETVYKFTWPEQAATMRKVLPSSPGWTLYAKSDLEVEDAGRKVFPGRELFLAVMDLPFTFHDRTYLWDGGSDNFGLRSQMPPRGSRNSGEFCEFQKPGEPRYKREEIKE